MPVAYTKCNIGPDFKEICMKKADIVLVVGGMGMSTLLELED